MKLFNRDGGPVLSAIVSDLHTNSTTGLFPGASFPLDDGGMYYASRTQRFIHEAWMDYWSIMFKKRQEHKAKLLVVFDGDCVDGDHHETSQIVSRNEVTQHRMAHRLIDPIAQEADWLFFARGTRVHTGKCSQWDEKLAEDFGAHPAVVIRNPLTGKEEVAAWAFWHLKLNVQKVRMDIAHHTTRSRVPRSKGHSAGRLAADTMMRYVDRGEEPPDLVFRGHVHVAEDSYDNHRTRAIILGCWQAPTEYGHRIATGDMPTIAGAWALCENGQYEAGLIKYPWKEEAWIGI